MNSADIDFAALYLRYRGSMYGVAYTVLRGAGQEALAEDVVMETVTSIMERPPQEEVANWEAYIVRATRNKALDALRSAAVRHGGGPVEPHESDDRTVSVEDTAIDKVDAERAGAQVWDALPALEERERQILWKYKALGRPREEVAAEFKISPARVSQISTQALAKMRDKLSKEGSQ